MTYKWSHRGHSLYNKQNYHLAEQCATIAIRFQGFIVGYNLARAQPYLCRALTRYELGNIAGAQLDINEIKRLDTNCARVRKYVI